MHALLGLEIGYITNKDLFGSAKTLPRQHIGMLTQPMRAIGGSGIVLDVVLPTVSARAGS